MAVRSRRATNQFFQVPGGGSFRGHVREFCNKTSIHGLRYVTEDGANWFQSIFWILFVIFGGLMCCALMMVVWNRFQNNPTITSVETINYPVWNIAFPAVTICNPNKVQKSHTGKFIDILTSNGISPDEAENFMKSLSNLISVKTPSSYFTDSFNILEKHGYNTEKLMLELMQPCNQLLKRCVWMQAVVDCRLLFKTVKTDEGFCCTFNYFHTDQSFDGVNHTDVSEYKKRLLRVSGAGIHTGLNIIIDLQEQEYMSSTLTIPVAMIHVHDNYDYAEMRLLSVKMEQGQLMQIPVEPIIIDTDDDVRALQYKRRNCLFEGEESLSIGVYGYENCIIECRMNAIVDFCGCIPYYYNVRDYTYGNVSRFCRIEDMTCVNSNHGRLFTLNSGRVSNDTGLNCTCFQTCDIAWYTYTTDVGYMTENVENSVSNNTIAVHVYFSELSCLKYKQSSIITWDGLFASFGGIFGLCLGGSLISIVEVVYHFTVKLLMKSPTSERAVAKERRRWVSIRQLNRNGKIEPKAIRVYTISKRGKNPPFPYIN